MSKSITSLYFSLLPLFYLLNMGGDYWLDLGAPWDNFKTNGGIGMGRFKYVRTNWQAFNMTTLPESELRRNPPPIE